MNKLKKLICGNIVACQILETQPWQLRHHMAMTSNIKKENETHCILFAMTEALALLSACLDHHLLADVAGSLLDVTQHRRCKMPNSPSAYPTSSPITSIDATNPGCSSSVTTATTSSRGSGESGRAPPIDISFCHH